MSNLRVTGFEGINKVKMDRAIKDHLNCGLNEAKSKTDQLLTEGELIFLALPNEKARALKASLEEAHATVEILSD